MRWAARGAGVAIKEFCFETLQPLGDVPGGYVANVGGVASNVPGTMSAFQKLLGRIERVGHAEEGRFPAVGGRRQ